MLLFTVLIGADHAAFENGEHAFNGIGVNVAPHVFILAMGDEGMFGKLKAELLVDARFIGHQARFFGDVLTHKRRDLGKNQRVDNLAANLASLTIYEGQHLHFVMVSGTLWNAFLLAEKGFIYFNGTAFRTKQRGIGGRPHGLANTMRHEPRRLEGDAQSAGKLVSRNALLRRAKQMDCSKPVAHGDMARFEDGPNLDGKRLAT